MKKVKTLNELRAMAKENNAYKTLLLKAAENLGWDGKGDVARAFYWLELNAMETTERGVVQEVNALLHLWEKA